MGKSEMQNYMSMLRGETTHDDQEQQENSSSQEDGDSVSDKSFGSYLSSYSKDCRKISIQM